MIKIKPAVSYKETILTRIITRRFSQRGKRAHKTLHLRFKANFSNFKLKDKWYAQ